MSPRNSLESITRESTSAGRPSTGRLPASGILKALTLAGALGAAAACSCGGSPSRHVIGEGGKPDAGTTMVMPDSGTVEPSQDAGSPVFVVDAGPTGPDTDGDGISDIEDGCPYSYDEKTPDGLAIDTDGDGIPNSCDLSPLTADPTNADTDRDGVGDVADNAPTVPNANQADTDRDGVPDVIDKCPADPDPAQIDADDDGFTAGCDCDDGDAAFHPDAIEGPCSQDTNCDGRGIAQLGPDGLATFSGEPECACLPGQVMDIGVEAGVCHKGELTCLVTGEGSQFMVTTPAVGDPTAPEVCGDGLDGDCDGTVDEDCPCSPIGVTQPCGPTAEIGECKKGAQTCEATPTTTQWGSCEGAVMPTTELCNGEDDDCSGEIDDGTFGGAGGIPGQTRRGRGACGLDDENTGGVDEGSGLVECDGAHATRISVNPNGSADRSSEELCNEVDDDCDGAVDEGDWSGAGAVGVACSLPGPCGAGISVCVANKATGCNSDVRREGNPGNPESVGGHCGDGIDNNCNGTVDEGCDCESEETQPCGINVGACKPGVQTCDANGHFSGACGGPNYVGPTTEVCGDGIDNDCDGAIDEFGNGRVGQACRGKRLSRCDVDGVLECDTANGGLKCTSDDLAIPEICNGLDDDCEGTPDNGLGVGTVCPAVGECAAGRIQCAEDGTPVCSTGPDGTANQATVEMCNELDDDCDGVTDEGCLTCVPEATQNCGTDIGVCEFGTQTCGADEKWETACAEGVVPATELCNGLDDNCNGAVDETFKALGLGYDCDGIGECGASKFVCKADGSGIICPTDIGGSSHGDINERCNDKDDNCNGIVDDGIPARRNANELVNIGEACEEPGRCGVGEWECDGPFRAACSSKVRAILETCNGVDDDCNGVVDDGFAPNLAQPCTTTCGTISATRCSSDGLSVVCAAEAACPHP